MQQPHLSTLAVTKYAPSTLQSKYLKRSASSASHFVSASRLSGLNDIPFHINASHLTGYQKNEFDTSKFATGNTFLQIGCYHSLGIWLKHESKIIEELMGMCVKDNITCQTG